METLYKFKARFAKEKVDWKKRKFLKVGEVTVDIEAEYYAKASDKAWRMIGKKVSSNIHLGTFISLRPPGSNPSSKVRVPL